MATRLHDLLLTSTALLALGVLPSVAGPEGASVVGGTATVSGAGTSSVTVNQSSDRAIINWHTFNIGAGETTRFDQPNASSVVLNRVTGGLGPSTIDGTLVANGRVFLINRDGMLFGPNAAINTAGFLASTHDIKNDDFMAGRYHFGIAGRPDASIVNLGSITAERGGFAALVAPGVRNSGTITATLGSVSLAAGNMFTLDMYGDKLIQLGVNDQIAAQVIDVATGKPLKALVSNEGKVAANGGRVELSAVAARAIVDSVINTKGVIEANSVGSRNGRIVLGAATGSSKGAGAPQQTVKVSGTLSAAGKQTGERGGRIVVSGESIEVAGAGIDASGQAGGGRVLLGGDWGGGTPTVSLVGHPGAALEPFAVPTATTLRVDAATTVNVSATGSGPGGKVVLWSDQQTTFAGTILARGGEHGGDGGFAEVSSTGRLDFTGTADLRAPNGSAGTLLLDPRDLVIQEKGPDSVTDWGQFFTSDVNTSVLTTTTLVNALSTGNVIVQTGSSGEQAGDITVASSFSWSSGNSLTLSAHRNINLNANTTITNTGGADVVLRADSQGTGIGTVQGSGMVSTSGTVSIFYNPRSYTSPTDFSQNVSGGATLNAYMLVNTFADLQNVAGNLSGTYALGRDIIAGSMSPIGSVGEPFTGVFDGQFHTIDQVTVYGSGLFGTIGQGGAVRNLNLTDVNVSGYYTESYGAVAGVNHGTIEFVVAGGTVTGSGYSGVAAGGLVGTNHGTIDASFSYVDVTVGNGSANGWNYAGGVAGINHGTITSSGSGSDTATGTVSGGSGSFVGGLVGQNDGLISSSFSFANVRASGNNPDDHGSYGGLVGHNDTSGRIVGGFAIGEVDGGTFANTSGGLVGTNLGTIEGSWAVGSITGAGLGSGQQAIIGGLVGQNEGTIINSITGPFVPGTFPTGSVKGGDHTIAGGLVGLNTLAGEISSSYALANVSADANSDVGGFAGVNEGRIERSTAGAIGVFEFNQFAFLIPFGQTVSAGSNSTVGGFVGRNTGALDTTAASGNVGGSGNNSIGGLAGLNTGSIERAAAFGSVAGGSNSAVGGLVGENHRHIGLAFATGTVSVNGDNSAVGGLVGGNFSGNINQTFATGAVSATGSANVLGGLAGLNATVISEALTGAISQSSATGSVNGSGNSAGSIGGLVGENGGSISETYAAGAVTGAADSAVGGLVGRNSVAFVLPAGTPFSVARGSGTVSNSYWDTQSSGQATSAVGTGQTTAQLTSALPVGFDPQVWAIGTGSGPAGPAAGDGTTYPYLQQQPGFFPTTDPPPPTPLPPAPQPPDSTPDSPPNIPSSTDCSGRSEGCPPATYVREMTRDIVFTAVPPELVNALTLGQQFMQQLQRQAQLQNDDPLTTGSAGYGPMPGRLNVGRGRHFYVPAAGENRIVPNEVVLQIPNDIPLERLQGIAGRLGLTIMSSQSLGVLGATAYRMQITNGRSVADVIRALAAVQIVAGAQANYTFTVVQSVQGADTRQGDAGQYVPDKLKLPDVHRLSKGIDVPIAVIDSEIDGTHPDLNGVIADRYNATDADEPPHSHGTGMAGAIASHHRLMGVAPGVKIHAVRAFSTKAATAEGTTFHILKGLDWAINNGVRIVNMSFAGPRDPSLERAFKTAYDKGTILIAAAGNAGPKSPPLYPAADPHVIAVTATDIDDKLFTGANRGRHLSVAAPGVDVLVPAPDNAYQMTTGTSVATAHVSGIVALLLERNPSLTPGDIRKILAASAKRLGPNNEFGAGLIDPVKALELAAPRSAAAPTRLRQAAH